jgi:hypothetical protein
MCIKDTGVPRIRVDFNELISDDLVLLAKDDLVDDAKGNVVCLADGLPVMAYKYNCYGDGTKEYLYVEGVAERNDPNVNGHWTQAAKWCCRFKGGVKSK